MGGVAPSAPRSTLRAGPRTLPCGFVSRDKTTSPRAADADTGAGVDSGAAGGAVGSAGHPGLASRRQLVAGQLGLGLGGALGREVRQGPLDLAPHSPDGDAENALPTLEQVDHLVVAGALIDRGAVA